MSQEQIFDPNLASLLAEMATAVYGTRHEFRDACKDMGFEADLYEMRNTAVGVAVSQDSIVIPVRGSDDILDWIGNFLSALRSVRCDLVPEGKIGFSWHRQAQRARKLLLYSDYASIESVIRRCTGHKVYLAGHSLGGSCVQSLAYWLDTVLRSLGSKVTAAYAFGPPRAGTKEAANWYAKFGPPTVTVANVSDGRPDLVTRVLFESWGWYHFGEIVVLSDDGRVLVGDRAWQEYRSAHPVSKAEGLSALAWQSLVDPVLDVVVGMMAHRSKRYTAKTAAYTEALKRAHRPSVPPFPGTP